MEDNQNVSQDTEMEVTAESVTNEEQKNIKEEKTQGKLYTRDELNKILNAEKLKFQKEAEAKRIESEKVAQMDAQQKSNYELEQARKENADLKSQINAYEVEKEATAYANSKGLPLGYISQMDFARETIESVKTKIDGISVVRSNDMKGYLNDKLKQPNPQEHGEIKKVDPYVQGFKNYNKK
jgi:hypothetical protein